MNPQRILCPVDFSDCSQKALNRACELAEESGAKLYIVHVQKGAPSHPPGTTGYVAELDEHRRLLVEAKPCSEKVDYEQHSLRGNVIDEIRRFAILREVDVIVMGTHGRTGLAKAIMGNVAETISEDPPCEVITVPLGTKNEDVAAS